MIFSGSIMGKNFARSILFCTAFILSFSLLPKQVFSTNLNIPAYCSTIRDMVEDTKGNIWVATFGAGLWKITPKGNKKFSGTSGQTLFPMISNLLLEDNYLWAATAGGGCVCINLNSGAILDIAQLPGFEKLHALYRTSQKDLLIGSVGSGTAMLIIDAWQSVSNRVLQHLAWVNDITEWEGKLWLGTANGLYSTSPIQLQRTWAPTSAGLREGVNHLLPTGKLLYISTTTSGVFMMKPGKQPIPVRNTYGEIHFVTNFKGKIIAGGKYGLWEIKDGKGKEISNFPTVIAKSFLRTRKNLLLIGTLDGKILETEALKDFSIRLDLNDSRSEETRNAN